MEELKTKKAKPAKTKETTEEPKNNAPTKTNFVLDTNVLLTDPRALSKFGNNNIVLPITVIEELDKFKRDLSDLGRNAREVTRTLDRYREKGSLSKGVATDHGGGTLRVWTDLGETPPLPFPTLWKTADSLILASALLLKKRENLPVVFVSRDINLRLRADAVGLKAENYEEGETKSIEELYSGRRDVELGEEAINQYVEEKVFFPYQELALQANQCIVLRDKEVPDRQVLGRFHADSGNVRPIIDEHVDCMGIRARNVEQQFAIDLLLDDKVQIVSLAGHAGTGKTLLAIAAGLKKVLEEQQYSKLVVARPIMPLGKELGFLPGEMGEKLRPWMEPVFDNLEFILQTNRKRNKTKYGKDDEDTDEESDQLHRRRKSSIDSDILQQNLDQIMNKHHEKDRDDEKSKQQHKGKGRHGKKKHSSSISIGDMLDSGLLEVQPLTYVRGRSLPDQFLIIDEAQNLTVHEVKTVVTRAGEGTKVILTGDPYQIDNPFLDSTSCGLAVAIEKLKGQALAGHITLTKGERSALSEIASDLL